ncbi:MAG: HEAT repeat domain-containing protein [Crocosphaera sp.]|nr:HEAT repeat domain-containing protein [Crocosphaera sp.]
MKILAFGLVLPLLLHDPIWGQERCSEAEIKANIQKLGNNDYEPDKSIIKCKEKSINLLIDTLQNKDQNPDVRRSAADALGEIKSSSLQVLDSLVNVVADKSDDYDVRIIAADALGKIKSSSPKVLDSLVNVVADTNNPDYVRYLAADALGKIKSSSPKVLDTLIHVVADKRDDNDVRGSAADALGKIASISPQVLDTLIRVVADKSDNSYIRRSAADALGEIASSSPQVLDTLDTLIRVVADKSDNSDVRRSAADALGEIKSSSSQVLNTLIRVLADKRNNSDVRRSAADALGEIASSSPQVLDTLDTLIRVVADKSDNSDVRRSAADALGEIKSSSSQVLDTLIDVVADQSDDSDVRRSAADALGEIKSSSPQVLDTLDTLIRVVADKSDNSDVRRSAADSLGSLGWTSPPVVATLTSIVSDKGSDLANTAVEALVNIGYELEEIIREDQQKISRENLKEFLKEFENARKVLEANHEDFEPKQISDIKGTIYHLRQTVRSDFYEFIFHIGWKGWLFHSGFWLLLIFYYPKYPFIQAIFFWNPKVRKYFGLWYVDLALIWIPFLRSRLFAPFKDSLLADAHLDSFDPNSYFPNSHVKQKAGTSKSQPIPDVIPQIKSQLIIEGESGLGKSMFLRDLARKSQHIVVYLPAKKCEQGVLEGIKNKLQGHVKEDPNFLKNLIYSGAIDICIDGLNEVTPDTRANITHFVESYFKGNIIMATQPLEWTPPSTAKTYILQPLQDNQIEDFLCSRTTILPEDSSLKGQEYEQVCRNYLTKTLAQQQSHEEQIAIRRMLSNPMDLTIIAQMLAENKIPNLLKLQQEQYEMMAEDYDQLYPVKKFPLKDFSEAVYQMRINDQYTIPAENWQQELQCMERYKMVISRQIKQEEKTEIEWYFRHDKIQDFFVVQTFLEAENENRLLDHISDSRFRGVYFLLATMMPFDAAKKLREDLIQYAADTKDHTVSDTFIQLFRNRQVAYV